MTTRLYAHASTLGAVLCTAAACYTATHGAGWIALSSLYTSCLLAWNARRCYTQARHEQAVWQRLERLNDQTSLAELPPPCCSFWRHSDGEVHGPDCTRPAAARTTLPPTEQTAFEQITASFHRAGGAV